MCLVDSFIISDLFVYVCKYVYALVCVGGWGRFSHLVIRWLEKPCQKDNGKHNVLCVS